MKASLPILPTSVVGSHPKMGDQKELAWDFVSIVNKSSRRWQRRVPGLFKSMNRRSAIFTRTEENWRRFSTPPAKA